MGAAWGSQAEVVAPIKGQGKKERNLLFQHPNAFPWDCNKNVAIQELCIYHYVAHWGQSDLQSDNGDRTQISCFKKHRCLLLKLKKKLPQLAAVECLCHTAEHFQFYSTESSGVHTCYSLHMQFVPFVHRGVNDSILYYYRVFHPKALQTLYTIQTAPLNRAHFCGERWDPGRTHSTGEQGQNPNLIKCLQAVISMQRRQDNSD